MFLGTNTIPGVYIWTPEKTFDAPRNSAIGIASKAINIRTATLHPAIWDLRSVGIATIREFDSLHSFEDQIDRFRELSLKHDRVTVDENGGDGRLLIASMKGENLEVERMIEFTSGGGTLPTKLIERNRWGNDPEWSPAGRESVAEWSENIPGVWVPKSTTVFEYNLDKTLHDRTLSRVFTYVFEWTSVNEQIPHEMFTMAKLDEPPGSRRITDYSTNPATVIQRPGFAAEQVKRIEESGGTKGRSEIANRAPSKVLRWIIVVNVLGAICIMLFWLIRSQHRCEI